MTNPFTEVFQGKPGPSRATSEPNPFDAIAQGQEPNPFTALAQGRPALDERGQMAPNLGGDQEDPLWEQMGKVALQVGLSIPQILARFTPGAHKEREYLQSLQDKLEPNVGPAATPGSDRFAADHPILQEAYLGLKSIPRSLALIPQAALSGDPLSALTPSTDEGLRQFPGDVQAAGQAITAATGEYLLGSGEFKLGRGLVKTATEQLAERFPRIADKATMRIGSVAAGLANRLGGGETATTLAGAIIHAPEEIATAAVVQAATDPNFPDTKSIGQTLGFGLLGALGEGAAFGRAMEPFRQAREARINRLAKGDLLKRDLGTVSEAELQQEMADVVPSQKVPVLDEEAAAKARVDEARRTPFPGQEAKPEEAQPPLPPINELPIRTLRDVDIVNASPSEIKDLAKRAKDERNAEFEKILGPTGGRMYSQRLRALRGPDPKAAADAATGLEKQRSNLTPEQVKYLDDLDTQGFTVKRLRSIARDVKDYTPEALAKKSEPELLDDLGKVIMSPQYGKSVSGLYRVQRLYTELTLNHGTQPQDIIRSITTQAVTAGFNEVKALTVAVSRMAEVAGSVDDLKRQVAGPVQAPTIDAIPLGPRQEEPLINDKGQVVSVPSNRLKQILRGIYKGDDLATVFKETLQNAIDAVREKFGLGNAEGKVKIEMDTKLNRLVITDNGTGMRPEQLVNEFIDPGSSGKKGSIAIGSHGTAKAVAFLSADRFDVVTIADTPQGRVKSTFGGTKEQWDQGLPMEPPKVEPTTEPTGTVLTLQLNPGVVEAANDVWSKYGAKPTLGASDFLNRFLAMNNTGVKLEYWEDGYQEKGKYPQTDAEKLSVDALHASDVPDAMSKSSVDLQFWESQKTRAANNPNLYVNVLNRGMFQFQEILQVPGEGLPHSITVDVHSKVDSTDPNYPFNLERQGLKGEAVGGVKEYANKLALRGREAEARIYREAYKNAVPIEGSPGHVIFGHEIPKEILETVGRRKYTIQMNKFYESAFNRLTDLIQRTDKAFPRPKYFGFFISSDIFGLNIRSDRVNSVEKIFPDDAYRIGLNVHKHIADAVATLGYDASDAAIAYRAAGQMWGTMVHEITHQTADGHGKEFSEDMSQYVGKTVEGAAPIFKELVSLFTEAMKEGISDDTVRLSTHWKESILKKVSNARDDLPGDAASGGGGEGGLQPPQEPAGGGGKERRFSKGALARPRDFRSEPRRPDPTLERSNEPGAGENLTDAVAASNVGGPRPRGPGIDPYGQNIDPRTLPPHSQELQGSMVLGPRPEGEWSGWFGTEDTLINRMVTYGNQTAAYGVDKYHALKTFDEAMGIKKGSERSAYIAARMASGTPGKVYQFLSNQPFISDMSGGVEFTESKALKKILEPLRGADNLNAYRRALVAIKAQELHDAGQESGFSPQAVTMELQGMTPVVRKALAERQQMMGDVRKYAEKFGLLDPEVGKLLEFLGNSHISWERVFDKNLVKKNMQVNRADQGPQYSALNVGRVFKPEIKNTDFKIVDPIATDVDFIRRVIRLSDRNRVGLLMVEAAEANPAKMKGLIAPENRGKDVAIKGVDDRSARNVKKAAAEVGVTLSNEMAREVAALMSNDSLKADGDRMIIRRNGKGESWAVAPELGQALRGLSPQEMGFWARAIGLVSNVTKAGITLDPSFAFTQAFIGSFHSAMQSQNGFRLGIDSFAGLTHKLLGDKEFGKWILSKAGMDPSTYQRWLASGGAYGHIGATTVTAEASLRSVLPMSVGGRIVSEVSNPGELLRKLLSPMNELNQLGEFARAKGRGKSDMIAAFESRNVDTDFSVVGLRMQGLAHSTQFLNPFIQGSRTALETFTRKPNVYQMYAVLGITLPSIYFWLAGEDDEELRNTQLTPIGQTNWLVRVGKDIYKIKKPILWGQIFGNTAELTLAKMKSDQPELFDIYRKGLQDQLIFQGLPSMGQTVLGLYSNKDYLTGAPIVPDPRENVESQLQETGNESQLARDVGEITGMSPAKIDFTLRTLGGTGGAQIIRLIDPNHPIRGVSPSAPVKADMPVLSRFIARYPSSGAEPIRTFYDRAERLEKVVNSASVLEKQATSPERAEVYKQYLLAHQDDWAIAPVYAETRNQLQELRDVIREIRNVPDKTLTPARKREIEDYVMRQMIDVSKRVNTAIAATGKYHRGEAQPFEP